MLLAYGMINLLWTEITGHSVYPVITWDSVTAVAAAVSVAAFYMLFWMVLCYLSAWKFRRLQMDEADQHALIDLAYKGNVRPGTVDETETIPTFDKKSYSDDDPYTYRDGD